MSKIAILAVGVLIIWAIISYSKKASKRIANTVENSAELRQARKALQKAEYPYRSSNSVDYGWIPPVGEKELLALLDSSDRNKLREGLDWSLRLPLTKAVEEKVIELARNIDEFWTKEKFYNLLLVSTDNPVYCREFVDLYFNHPKELNPDPAIIALALSKLDKQESTILADAIFELHTISEEKYLGTVFAAVIPFASDKYASQFQQRITAAKPDEVDVLAAAYFISHDKDAGLKMVLDGIKNKKHSSNLFLIITSFYENSKNPEIVQVLFDRLEKHVQENRDNINHEETEIIGAIVNVNDDDSTKQRLTQIVNDLPRELSLSGETDWRLKGRTNQSVINDFVKAGIIIKPTPAGLYTISYENDIFERVGPYKIPAYSPDTINGLLLESRYQRRYGYDDEIYNSDFLFMALTISAPNLKCEGVWEENSGTDNATLNWIIDNRVFSAKISSDEEIDFYELVDITNSALKDLNVDSHAFFGDDDDNAHIWFINKDRLIPIFDKHEIRYYLPNDLRDEIKQ